LAAQAVAGGAVEGAEGDALRGGRRREEGDGTGDQRELEVALPVGSGCHYATFLRKLVLRRRANHSPRHTRRLAALRGRRSGPADSTLDAAHQLTGDSVNKSIQCQALTSRPPSLSAVRSEEGHALPRRPPG